MLCQAVVAALLAILAWYLLTDSDRPTEPQTQKQPSRRRRARRRGAA